MSRSDGQSEVRPPVFKSPSKLGTHLSTQCRRDERLSRPCPAQERNILIVYIRDDERMARVSLMARDTIFLARHQSKRLVFWLKITKFTMEHYKQI
ncbi:hypothetical protein TNCV_2839221 [Trichonephila clavipes]|nr:hypothetical protein TNCV_2839221 [Trichonephila clavipes]